jgi:hypothetical protein
MIAHCKNWAIPLSPFVQTFLYRFLQGVLVSQPAELVPEPTVTVPVEPFCHLPQ